MLWEIQYEAVIIDKPTDIHPQHPLYLHPDDTPSSILITQQQTGIKIILSGANSR